MSAVPGCFSAAAASASAVLLLMMMLLSQMLLVLLLLLLVLRVLFSSGIFEIGIDVCVGRIGG